jgi:hypothetical protein
MCQHCDSQVNEIRPLIDAIVNGEREQRKVYRRSTQEQHVVRLANVILDGHLDDDDEMTAEAMKTMTLGYALVIQRLLALQELTGLLDAP